MSLALLPVRCHTSGHVIGKHQIAYEKHLRSHKNATPQQFFEKHKINLVCCRRHFLTYATLPVDPDPTPTDRVLDNVAKLRIA